MPPVATAEKEQQRQTNSEGWIERKSPELYKFECEGDEVIGFLRKCFRELAEGKQVPTYLIENDSHELIKVRATFDLLQKISRLDTGSRLRIQLQGTQATTNGTMQKFNVWVKPGPKPQNNHEITDEDIPF